MEALVDELQLHVPQLRPLSEALQCQVCYSFYTGPVQLRCGHAFCSACIRKDLAFKRRAGHVEACPICRGAASEDDITPCHQLREAVLAFKALLPPLKHFLDDLQAQAQAQVKAPLPAARARGFERLKKRPRAQPADGTDVVQLSDSDEENAAPLLHRVSSATALQPEVDGQVSKRPRNLASVAQEGRNTSLLHDEPAGPEQRQGTEPPQGLPGRHSSLGQADPVPAQPVDDTPLPEGCVRCPVCCILIRQDLINTHIDHCLSRSQPVGVSDGGAGNRLRPNNHQRQRAPAPAQPSAARPPPAPLPSAHTAPAPNKVDAGRARPSHALTLQDIPGKLVFNVLKDKELKARLKQVGLPVDGSREDLAERYQAYRLYLQAKLDAGTTLGLPQLRDSFLAQQRQQQAARRASPALTGAVAPLGSLVPGRVTAGTSVSNRGNGGNRSSSSPDVFEIQGDQVVLTKPGRQGSGGGAGGGVAVAQGSVQVAAADATGGYSFKGLIAQVQQRAGKTPVSATGATAATTAAAASTAGADASGDVGVDANVEEDAPSTAASPQADVPCPPSVSVGVVHPGSTAHYQDNVDLGEAAGASVPASPVAVPPPAAAAAQPSTAVHATEHPGHQYGYEVQTSMVVDDRTQRAAPCAVLPEHQHHQPRLQPGMDVLGEQEEDGGVEEEEEGDGQEGEAGGWMWSADAELDVDM